MPPVIIYTLPKLDHGGAELRSLQLFRYLRLHHPALRIVLHSTSLEPGRLDSAFAATGARIVRGRPGVRGLIDFYRDCRRSGAEIAHINGGMKSGYYVLAAWLAGVKRRISHFRTETEERLSPRSRAQGRLGVWLMRALGTHIVGVSASARLYPRIPPHRWRTLYNGVECEDPEVAAARRPRSDGFRTLLVLGRIDQNKNGARAVAVFEELCRRHPQGRFRLRFVGAGTAKEQARLIARIEASPVAHAIAVHAVTDDTLRHLREASALLLTSKHEGLPGVVLEALAAGTPVVASDIPATREIAAAVDGVALVSLDAPDSVWAEALNRASGGARAAAIVVSFASGPFLLEDHAAAMAALWGLPPLQAPSSAAPPVDEAFEAEPQLACIAAFARS